MKPYMIVEGKIQAIDLFEKSVSDALGLGYSLAGELVVQAHASEIKLYQPMILSEDEDEEWEDEEEDEDEIEDID